jgi:hypothetical protein
VYTVRILNNERTLLGVLPVLSWKYNNRFNEASEFSITVARTLEPELSLDSEAYTLIEPHLPAVHEDAPAHFVQPNVYLSYYIQLYKGSELVAMGQVAKRDFSTNTVSIKAHTEEFELSKYSCPSDYSRCYDGMDICDLARDVTRAWRTSRVKAKSEWDSAVASSGIDTATEPSVVMLAKSGTAYVSSGYITLEFSRPFQWDRWERIRWSGDSEAPVYTTMAYRTYNGSVWTDWTAETEGAYPAELGVEIADTSAQKVQVRITLSTDDTTSEDDSGNPVGVTPRLFAVEVISRTAPMLTVSGDASSGVVLKGVDANEKSALQILQDAFELYGWEFYVLDGTLYIAEAFGSELGRLFRNGTNIDIHQLSDGLDDVYNVLKAKGQGSGINRPMIEISDAESILEYGVIEHVEEYDTSDITELTSLATADLNEHKDAKPTWKLNTMFPYGEEPDFGIGDIVKVADPNTGIVSTTRIEQEIRSYSGGKLDIECYLGVVRLDLVPRRNPQYRDTVPIERPITVRAIGGFKSIIVSVTKPLRLWETTEVYVSTTSGFTPSAGTLVSSQRATQFELTNLTAGTRYYIKARHVKTNGEYSSFSDEASAVPLMAQAEDLDIRIGFGIADNSPSAGEVRIHGIDASGQPTNDNGWIRSGSGSLVVPYTDVTLIDDKQNFLILSGGVVIPCWFDPNTNRMKNSAGTQVTTGYVIGYATVSSGSVTDSEAYDNAISIFQQINNQSAFILGMLAEAGEAGFADVAEAMGISNAFISLASYNAFIANLYVKNLKVGTGDSEEVEFDAIECNGSSSYAETSAFAIAGADRTFEMWIKPEIIDSYTGLFIQNTNADDTSSNNIVGFQGYPGSSNEITLAIGSGSAYYITGKVALPTGVWTHLAGVIEGGVSAKVYLNGNLLINEAISISPSTGSLKVIMGRIKDKYFKGMARDFRIWNTVRTQQQIQDNMLADLVGNESGLVALWKANEMAGATLTDSVGSNDATATGISWVTDIGVVGGTGFKFTAVQDDGTGKSRFDVYYNGERVFEANPQNGRVYFGNSFWYDPADGAIHTPNNKTVIKADGTIEAVDGVFSGAVNAEQGVFKGSIDSSAFASLPSSSGTTDNITLTSSGSDQVNTMVDYCETTLTINKYYTCSVSIDSSVKYMRYSGDCVNFYNSSFNSVAEMWRAYGTFGWNYFSSYSGSSLTVSVTYGEGDVFKFKALPTSPAGLASGQVWRDGTTLKIVI